jgi:hypothetical protein
MSVIRSVQDVVSRIVPEMEKLKVSPMCQRMNALTVQQRADVADFILGTWAGDHKTTVDRALTAALGYVESCMPKRRSEQDEAATFNAEGKR